MHGILWFFGVYPVPSGTSAMYQLWSGFIPALTVIGLSTLIVGAWHHLSCHVDRCQRLGRYPAAGGLYKTCRPHSPDENVRDGLTAHHILALHRQHAVQASGRRGAAGERLYNHDRDGGPQ